MNKIMLWFSNLIHKIKLKLNAEYQYEKRRKLMALTLTKINAECTGICTFEVYQRDMYWKDVWIRPVEFKNDKLNFRITGGKMSNFRMQLLIYLAKKEKFERDRLMDLLGGADSYRP